MLIVPSSVVAQTTTTEAAQSLLIFSEDWNIFYPRSRASKIPILCFLRRSFYALINDVDKRYQL